MLREYEQGCQTWFYPVKYRRSNSKLLILFWPEIWQIPKFRMYLGPQRLALQMIRTRFCGTVYDVGYAHFFLYRLETSELDQQCPHARAYSISFTQSAHEEQR